jgi:tetratricopeptide (TPR) repeat protein
MARSNHTQLSQAELEFALEQYERTKNTDRIAAGKARLNEILERPSTIGEATLTQAESLQIEGEQHFENQSYEKAIMAFARAEKIYITVGDRINAAICQMNRGYALVDLGQYVEAIAAFDAAEPVLKAHEQ